MRGRSVKILAGQSVSDEFDTGGRPLIGLIITGDWTAADISLQTSPVLGDEYQEVYWIDDAPVVIQAGANRTIMFRSSEIIFGLERIIFRSGTAALPVAQVAERIIIPLLG